jgi:hypothetical protein
VARAIHRGLEKSPTQRFATAAEFVAALGGSELGTPPRVAGASPSPASSQSGDHREAATVAAKRVALQPAEATTAASTGATAARRGADAGTHPVAGTRPRSRWPLAVAALLVLGVPLGVFLAMRNRGGDAGTVAVASDAATVALAIDASPASQHLESAREAERAGKPELAIAGYEAAYAARPDAALLVQIAELHEKLGKRADALTAYWRYLEAAPTASDATRIRARIDELAAQAAEPTKAATAKTATTKTRPPASKATGAMTCKCWQPEQNFLCQSLAPPGCRCEAGGAALCEAKPAFGQCKNGYTLPPGTRAAACKGWLGSHMERAISGMIRCRFCDGGFARRGRPDEPCQGYHPHTGAKASGVLTECRPD